jgi:hypothetical protein
MHHKSAFVLKYRHTLILYAPAGTAASTRSTKAAAPVVDTIAHVQKAVFAGLRSAPQLCAFLSSTYSTLTVTLAAYDSDERRVLQWSELLAHLLNHRNPYATVELLPGPSVSNWPLTREALRSELLAGDNLKKNK